MRNEITWRFFRVFGRLLFNQPHIGLFKHFLKHAVECMQAPSMPLEYLDRVTPRNAVDCPS
jgi:hypothetical protein